MNNSPEFCSRENFLAIPLNMKTQTQFYKYRVLRIPRKPRSRQQRWFRDIYGVQRVAAREKKRGGRIVYGRVELHDVDDDIMRVFLANVFLSVPRNLSSASSGPRIEDRKDSIRLRRLAPPWLETLPRQRESEKFPSGFALFSFRRLPIRSLE